MWKINTFALTIILLIVFAIIKSCNSSQSISNTPSGVWLNDSVYYDFQTSKSDTIKINYNENNN